jgi:isochorismate synthase
VDPGFEAAVRRALEALRAGTLEKVVLARRVPWAGEGRLPTPTSVLRALLTAQPTAYVFGVGHGGQSFVGASPELLLRVRADDGVRQLETEALAGTAPRSEAPQELLESAKDRHEHAVVVDAIRAAISPHCEPGSVHVPATPEVVTLPNLHHLRTPISGRLRPGVSPRAVLAALHPTPAVCGTPRADAQAWLSANEGFPRVLYAGPVGFDTPEHSLWVVGLRCAHLTDTAATLYAGVGLVSESKPVSELAETGLKLSVMRSALRQAALEAP